MQQKSRLRISRLAGGIDFFAFFLKTCPKYTFNEQFKSLRKKIKKFILCPNQELLGISDYVFEKINYAVKQYGAPFLIALKYFPEYLNEFFDNEHKLLERHKNYSVIDSYLSELLEV